VTYILVSSVAAVLTLPKRGHNVTPRSGVFLAQDI
jgi:hypothetical protein